MFEDLFGFVIVFVDLPVFRYLNPLTCLYTTAFVHRNKWDHYLLPLTFLSLLVRLFISANFKVLFKNSPCMLCKALSIPKNYRMSKSVFCDAYRVLT